MKPMSLTGLAFVSMLSFPGMTAAQVVEVTECKLLPEHKADAGVAYKPGVDVNGKPVVPADINAPPVLAQGEAVVVPLTIDLAQRLQNQNIQGLELKSTQGFLEIYPDGRVTYNGQDLTTQVYTLCGKTPPTR